jgi:hypothetical protein
VTEDSKPVTPVIPAKTTRTFDIEGPGFTRSGWQAHYWLYAVAMVCGTGMAVTGALVHVGRLTDIGWWTLLGAGIAWVLAR